MCDNTPVERRNLQRPLLPGTIHQDQRQLHPSLCHFYDLALPQHLSFCQVYIQTWGAPGLSLSINRDEYPDSPLVLRGINSQGASSQQYQPVLMMSKSYTLHWSGTAPRELVLSLINFDK